MIGGATTSDKHTAVRIAPEYKPGVIHVLDASRSVGVVDRLINQELKPQFIQENSTLQSTLVAGYEERQMTLVPYEEAYEKRFQTEWDSADLAKPGFTGTMSLGTTAKGQTFVDAANGHEEIKLDEIARFIDWTPFFMSWELHGKYPKILEDKIVGEEATRLFGDAQLMLKKIIDEDLLDEDSI